MTELERDLLAACEAVVPWLHKAIDIGAFERCVSPSGAEKALALLQATIAKAKGAT